MYEPNLPAEVWAKVFHKLDISDLLVIGVVATQFYLGVQWCCDEIKSVTFLIGDGSSQMRDSSQLMFPLTPEERAQRIALFHHEWSTSDISFEQCLKMGTVLTKVTHFEIALHFLSYYDSEKLITLLKGWKATMVCLKITIERTKPYIANGQRDTFQFNVNCLLETLNELTALKHLTLVFHNELDLTTLDLAVLRRLDEFNFSTPNDMKSLFNSLLFVNNASHAATLRIDIRNKLSRVFKFTNLEQIASKIVRLDISRQLDSQRELNWVTDMFTKLSTLSMNIAENLSFNKLAQSLEKLHNLTNFTFFVNFRDPDYIKWDTGVLESSIPRLTAIKQLTLEVVTKKSNDLLACNFEWIFPSVENVKFVDRQTRLKSGQFRWERLLDESRSHKVSLNELLDQNRAWRRWRARIERVEWIEDDDDDLDEDEIFAQNLDNLIERVFGPVDEDEPTPEEQAIKIAQQHYDNPERRTEFIREYLQPLSQSCSFESVDVYQRIRENAEISPLLYSYTSEGL